MLLGGLDPGPDADSLLSTFWKTYKIQHPTHKIFSMGLDMARTIPMMIHGDGARTAKKQPLEVVSLIAVLGLDTKEDVNCHCPRPFYYSKDFSIDDPMVQKLNNRHHSYLHHFLMFCSPGKRYKATPGLLKSMLRRISEDLSECCQQGIYVDGDSRPYHIGIIGLRGDAEWHSKTGVLNRSYRNVGHVNQIPCCHQCDAGAPGIPFESFRSDAEWKSTIGRTVPWSLEPPYAPIQFEPWDNGSSAKFFRYDPFHVFRLGIARNFCASAIVYFCNEGLYDFPGDDHSVPGRLGRAWASFLLFCETDGKKPASMRSFSKEKLHYGTTTSFPFVSCKGSDTILLLQYLKWFSGLQICHGNTSEGVRLVKKGSEQGLNFQGFHRHGLWLNPQCRDYICKMCRGFCHTYSRLAAHAYGRQMTLFGLVPKAHSLGHIYVDLESSRANQYTLNAGVWDTSMSEDFVGQVGRQSRRVGYKNLVHNTLLAYRIRMKFVIKRFKKNNRTR